MADRYALELQALAASLTTPAGQDPTVLTLDPQAGELLLAFEQELEPRLAAGGGDLAQLAGWAAKLAGATCRLAALLHLASHLRHGWAQPIGAEAFAGAVELAGYLVEHVRAVFDLMGADPRLDDACWLLDWIGRTGRAQFSRRDAHAAAPRGRFPKATDLESPLRLLEEHGYLRRVDPEPSRDPHGRGRPASPRFLVNLLPRATETTETTKPPPDPFLWILWFPWTVAGVPTDGSSGRRHRAREGGRDRASGSPRAVTLSNENGLSRSRPSQQTRPAPNDRRRPLLARRNSHCRRGSHPPGKSQLTPMRTGCPWSRDR